MKFFSARIFVLGLLFLSSFFIESQAFAKILHSTSEDTQQLRIKLSSEEEGEYLKNQSQYWGGCPYSLIEKTERDAKLNVRNWYGKKVGDSDDFCMNALSRVVDAPDPIELSKKLATHPMTGLGDSEKNLSEKCINTVKDPSRRKFLVAEYYSNMTRLKIASLATLESMAAMDSLLGEKSLQDLECPREGISYVVQACQKLKTCEPKGGLDLQAKELQEIYPQYLKLKKDFNDYKLFNALSTANMGPSYVPRREEILEFAEREKKAVEIENKIQALESIYPILTGKEFLKTFESSKQNYKEAIQKQIQQSRKKVFEQFNQYHAGVQCMRGTSGCLDFEEILSKTPLLNIEDFNRGEELTVEDGQVRDYLGAVECRQAIRKVNENQKEAIRDFGVGMALSFSSIFLGAYAGYCNASVSAIKNSVLLPSLASRQAMMRATVSLSKKATFASRSILGFDLFTLGRNGVEAYNHCSKELNQLSNQKYKRNTSSEDVLCPSESTQASSQPQLVANYRSCVAKSILAGVSGMMLPSELRETLEGPFKGAIGVLKKASSSLSKAKDKEAKDQNKSEKQEEPDHNSLETSND